MTKAKEAELADLDLEDILVELFKAVVKRHNEDLIEAD